MGIRLCGISGLLGIILLYGCVRQKDTPIPVQSVNWYPLVAEFVQDREVHDTVFTESDTLVSHYYLRDSVRELEILPGGFRVYPVDIYRYEQAGDTILQAIRRELRFSDSGFWGEQLGNVKVLVFPISPYRGYRWNALRLQAGLNEYRQVLSIDSAFSGCESCAVVLLRNDATALEYHYGIDAFQPEYGLYYRWEKTMEYSIIGGQSVLRSGSSIRRIRI